MSGTRHEAYIDSKTINIDKNRIVSQTDERISYTMATKEVPLISYNDMQNIPPCNSMVFRIGASPIWNRNQMALPMAHCIHKNQINVTGKKFTLLSVPTTSSALEFDLTAMVPDFDEMLEQRLTEYEMIDMAEKKYQLENALTDEEVHRISQDADTYATEIMSIVNQLLREQEKSKNSKPKQSLQMVENDDIKQALKEEQEKHAESNKLRYAEGMLSREAIIKANDGYMDIFYEAFMETRDDWKRNPEVIFQNDGVKSKDGRMLIDFNNQELKAYGKQLAEASQEDGNRIYSEEYAEDIKTVHVRHDFITWLCELESWPNAFDAAVARLIAVNK